MKVVIFFKRLLKFRKLNSRYDFDIVVSFGATANIINILASKKGKTIITEHNVKSIENKVSSNVVNKVYNKIYDFLMKNLYNKADVIVPVSKVIGYDLVKMYDINQEKIHVIYNGVNDKIINFLQEEELSQEEKKIFAFPTIVNVGATSPQKGQWHLIRLMPYLREKIPNAQLVILGTGIYFDKLLELKKSLGLEDCVHLLGVKKNPYKYMKQARLFVLSSIFEGFPNVLIEALTTGQAVVSVDCKSGPRELLLMNSDTAECTNDILYGDYGILVPPFDDDFTDEKMSFMKNEKILADAIYQLLTDKILYETYCEQSKKRALQFTAKKMTYQYEELFKK